MTTTAKANALIVAAEKATAGPWRIHPEKRFGDRIVAADARCSFIAQCSILNSGDMRWEPHPLTAVANADFIFTARNDAPDIARAYLEAMERLRALADRADADMKYNMDEETPGWWSTRTAEAIADARAFLAKHDGPATVGEEG